MILSLDIGNTNIHAGFYQNENLVRIITLPVKIFIRTQYLKQLLKRNNIEGIGIASVVPEAGQKIADYINEYHGIKMILINPSLKLPVRIAYNKNLGADRIASIAGGFVRYRQSLIILSFGTAITFDVVSRTGIHYGGVIMPGVETQLWSINQKTAQIKTSIMKPGNRLLGRSTNECIQSGIFNGIKLSIQGFIKETMKQRKQKYKVIATGGWGKTMMELIPEINRYDHDLTLYGIMKLFHLNAQ